LAAAVDDLVGFYTVAGFETRRELRAAGRSPGLIDKVVLDYDLTAGSYQAIEGAAAEGEQIQKLNAIVRSAGANGLAPSAILEAWPGKAPGRRSLFRYLNRGIELKWWTKRDGVYVAT
jgi:hypothetical protein